MSSSSSSLRVHKPRRQRDAHLVRRKRAATACQLCRLRKTKCDNVRPVCGFCLANDGRCTYGQGDVDAGAGAGTGAPATGEAAAPNPGNHEILARLAEIKELLVHGQQPPPPPTITTTATPTANGPQLDGAPDSSIAGSGATLPHPHAATRCERLLKWPVLQAIVPPQYLSIDSFVLDGLPHVDVARSVPRPAFGGHGINEAEFVPLCHKFLAHVYPRNPILEADDLISHAKVAAENGLDWDAPSCLVLLACALACYTQPWGQQATGTGVTAPASKSSNDPVAEAYFLAAAKRLGLLGAGLTDIQCLFLASMYQKCALRPLEAWFHVHQAATRLQARHLGRIAGLQRGAFGNDKPLNHLEQRLLWSCFKAESELVPELGLLPSGIEKIAGDETFPSPPEEPLAHDGSAQGPSPASDDARRILEEQSWFFYIAEISVRRTMNSTLTLLYGQGEEDWMRDVGRLSRQCAEASRQVSLWQAHLPPAIRFDGSAPPGNELSHYIRGRFSEWQEYVLRPLLYCALHRTPRDPPLGADVLSGAQDAVDVCAESIAGYSYAHASRHGGTWFMARKMFGFAAVILAVVARRGEVVPPENWPSLVNLAIASLVTWSAAAPDVDLMRRVLEEMMVKVGHGDRY